MQKHILFLLLFFIFASCKTVEKQKPKDFKNLTLQDFYGEEWEFTGFLNLGGDYVIQEPPFKNQRYTLVIEDVKNVSGRAYCNNYSGNYSLDSNTIRFSNIISTQHQCHDKTNEKRFFEWLKDTKTFVLYQKEESKRDKFIFKLRNTIKNQGMEFVRDTL